VVALEMIGVPGVVAGLAAPEAEPADPVPIRFVAVTDTV
jgi:hypothetical protein